MESSNNPKTVRHPQKQPLSANRYLLISFGAFLIGILILLLFVFQADSLAAKGISEKVFYILLLPLGLSAGAFLYGVMRSYALYAGKALGGSLTLGGPVVIFALVVVGGFKLIPETSTFSVTVYIHGAGGRQDITLLKENPEMSNSGVIEAEVMIDLEGDRRTVRLGEYGEAHFNGIPSQFRNQSVPISVNAKNPGDMRFEFKKPAKLFPLDGKPIYIEIQAKVHQVTGTVRDEESNFLEGVRIRVGEVHTETDENGYFKLQIPAQNKISYNLTAHKNDFRIWEAKVYPESPDEIKIILEKK